MGGSTVPNGNLGMGIMAQHHQTQPRHRLRICLFQKIFLRRCSAMRWGLFYGLLTFHPRKKLRLLAFSVRGEVLLECKKPSLKRYYRRNHCLTGLTENKIKAASICLDFRTLGNTWMIDTYPFPHIKKSISRTSRLFSMSAESASPNYIA